MAFRHGKYAEIVVNGKSLSTFCDTADLKWAVSTAATTTFGSTWNANITGIAGADFAIGGDFDPTVTTGPAAVIEALIGVDPFACQFFPGGNVAGQRKQIGRAHV